MEGNLIFFHKCKSTVFTELKVRLKKKKNFSPNNTLMSKRWTNNPLKEPALWKHHLSKKANLSPTPWRDHAKNLSRDFCSKLPRFQFQLSTLLPSSTISWTEWRKHTRHDSFSNTIFYGCFGGRRRRGQQRKYWMDNVKEWTLLPMPELLKTPSRKKDRKRIAAESFLIHPHPHPDQMADVENTLKCHGWP